MKLLEVHLNDAPGHLSAHNLFDAEGRRLATKGQKLGPRELAQLRAAGIERLWIARLDGADVIEDEAARRLAERIAGDHIYFKSPATGRANLRARCAGVVRVNGAAVVRLNASNQGVGLATLPANEFVRAGQLVATVKIIPFALEQALLQEMLATLEHDGPVLRVDPIQRRRIGIAVCAAGDHHARLIAQYRPALEERMRKYEAEAVAWIECDYSPSEIAAAIDGLRRRGAEMVLLVGMSAVVDSNDVIPQGIRAAGATIEQFGFPVDPGNLTLLAYQEDMPIVAVPGCARSPKRNALDLIWPRLLCSERLGQQDILQLGIGGLLEEIHERPLPREQIDMENDGL